jgi:hypothetical protein
MGRKSWKVTEEVKQAVVRDYERGEKVVIITMEHHIDHATMYRILREKNVILRRHDVKVTRKNPDPKPEKHKVDAVDEVVKSAEILKKGSVPNRPGNFVFTITSTDLAPLEDTDFELVWDAIGIVLRARQGKLEKLRKEV